MIPLQILLASVLGWSGDLDGVVLDFSAAWCGPCQEMSPIVARLERQGYPVRKVDIDANPELARRFNVQRIPTFILVIDDREQARFQGRMSEDALKQLCARIPQRPRQVDAPEPAESRPAADRRQGRPNASENAPTEAPAPRKPGLRIPFLGGKQPDPPARNPEEGAVPRGNIEDRPVSNVPLRGNPLAASVRIRIRDAQGENVGSGTIIDSRVGKTIVLTCGHIFRHWDKQAVIEVDYFSDGRPQTVVGRRLYHDLEDDVGLIVINVDPLPSCRVAPPGMKVLKGAPVVNVGCSNGENPTVQSLRVTALNRYLGADNIECSGMPAEGRSGGGLFTRDGQLIGVCMARDPHNHEGLYAGLKTVHTLLERCQLAELYRSGGGQKPRVSGPDQLEIAVKEMPEPADRALAGRARSGQTVPTTKTEPSGVAAREGDNSEAEERAIRSALQQSGEAEIVCIIRPINQPRAASRVVILNRASRRFVEYLSDELEADDIRPTTLTQSRSDSRRGRSAQVVKHEPVSEMSQAGPAKSTTTKRPAGPQPYRRKKSTD